MSTYRNPFKMRASERIESEATYLRLYSPTVLDALIEKYENDTLWDNVLFIQSSPGGGKTSLLRLFLPESLNSLYSYRSNNYYKSILKPLKKLEIITPHGVRLLGVMLSCTRNYAVLEDLPINEYQKSQFFFSLLNSRIIIATLREIVNLKKGDFPEDLDKISFSAPNYDEIPVEIPKNCSGAELYKWAEEIENRVYSSIHGFSPIRKVPQSNTNELFALSILKPENFKYEDEEIADKFLIMLDDAHKLNYKQRLAIKEYLIDKRLRANIWISERLQALKPKEIIPAGAYQEKDYDKINLEEFWSSNYNKFEITLSEIANKRIQIANEIQVDTFDDCLETAIDEEALNKQLKNINNKLSSKLKEDYGFSKKFNNWLEYADNLEGEELEKAIELQQIHILIAREARKSQLDFEFPLTKKELIEKYSSSVKNSAELFLTENHQLPFYYGLRRLVKISSSNIEQFLSFAAELFEEISSKYVLGESTRLSTTEQEKIIRRIVNKRWSRLNQVLPYAEKAIRFLERFGEFANQQTYRSTAPYSPGVTGIGIKMEVRKNLIDEENWFDNKNYEELIDVFSSLAAFNLVTIENDVSQGKKGDKWMVIYLNRWLCVKFNLPLNYGGWRHKKPRELIDWIKKK